MNVDNINFDRRFHKDIFFRRLGIGIYSLVGFVLNLIIFIYIDNLELATTLLLYLILAYALGFIIYSIILLITDKKIKYDINKINRGYKTGFIITKTLSYVTFVIGTSILILALIIGSIGISLSNSLRYDKGDISNKEPISIYNYEEFEESYYDVTIIGYENLKDFTYAETETRRGFGDNFHYSMHYSYYESDLYSQAKDELLTSNTLLNKSITDEDGNYIYPITQFEISGYCLNVVKANYLDDLHIIGYNDTDYSLVELKSDGSNYSNFGKDINLAEEAFIDYVTNVFYLPWCEYEE